MSDLNLSIFPNEINKKDRGYLKKATLNQGLTLVVSVMCVVRDGQSEDCENQ